MAYNVFVVFVFENPQRISDAMIENAIQHLCMRFARLAPDVWYLKTGIPYTDIFQQLSQLLTDDDRLIVVEANEAALWLTPADQSLADGIVEPAQWKS